MNRVLFQMFDIVFTTKLSQWTHAQRKSINIPFLWYSFYEYIYVLLIYNKVCTRTSVMCLRCSCVLTAHRLIIYIIRNIKLSIKLHTVCTWMRRLRLTKCWANYYNILIHHIIVCEMHRELYDCTDAIIF